MRVRGVRMWIMKMYEQCSALSWDVVVSSPLNGFRGCILADAWVAQDSALHRGDREGDCGCQHPAPRTKANERNFGHAAQPTQLPRFV